VRKLTCLPVVAGLLLTTALGVTGCSASGPIAAANAYIPVPTTPGETVAYLEIRNNGAADELTSVSTSIGGTVTMRAPVTRGTQLVSMRNVGDIPIPADTTVRLDPDSYHLLITGTSGMQSGKAITLTLTFAHAGTISIVALVTNPESGGSSYFLN
jgi:periplasmic copper chaperone A